MTQEQYQETVSIPENVQVTVDKGILSAKGPNGEATKNLFNPLVDVVVKDGQITFTANRLTKRTKKLLKTFVAHVNNICRGVVEGHVYRLKVCSGHFPMSVAVKNNTFEIKNFIGEKVPRTLLIKDGVSVKVDGSEVVVKSSSKDLAGQVSASIEKLTRRPNFDRRIFQDGIYMIEKDGKEIK